MKQQSQDRRTFEELIPLIRQKRLQTPQRLSRIVRTLVRFHDPLSRLLVRTNITAIQLTVFWSLISLLSFACSAWGAPWGFFLGAILLYAAIIVDLCDGEIGRYRALAMSQEEDLKDHINGIYLDRVFHFVSSQLWPLAIGLGLYRMHDDPYVLLASVPILLTINVHRLKPYLIIYMERTLAPKIQQVLDSGGLDYIDDRGHLNDWLIVRAGWWIGALIRNGKRSNFVILCASAVDCLLWILIGPHAAQIVHGLFLGAGAAALAIETCTLFGMIYMNTAILEVRRSYFREHSEDHLSITVPAIDEQEAAEEEASEDPQIQEDAL